MKIYLNKTYGVNVTHVPEANSHTSIQTINSAALTIWYDKLHKERWKKIIHILHTTITDVGRMLNDQNFYEFMYLGDFGPLYNADNFCRSFFNCTGTNKEKAAEIYNDPIFGLNKDNANKVSYWGSSLNRNDDILGQLAFLTELGSYFELE